MSIWVVYNFYSLICIIHCTNSSGYGLISFLKQYRLIHNFVTNLIYIQSNYSKLSNYNLYCGNQKRYDCRSKRWANCCSYYLFIAIKADLPLSNKIQ